MSIHYYPRVEIKKCNLLDPEELYEILKVREEVFHLEQHINVPDLDGVDTNAYLAMLLTEHDTINGCCRLFRDPEKPHRWMIGRLAVRNECRGHGYAKLLMMTAIREAYMHGAKEIAIHAQVYLLKFYETLGFQAKGEVFIEAGIQHIFMVYKITGNEKLCSYRF